MADEQDEVDPFAAMGGGVKRNGGWIPKNMLPPEEPTGDPGPPPGGWEMMEDTKPTSSSTTSTTPTNPNDPFAAMGGGIQVNGGWIPKNMATSEQIASYTASQGGTPASAAGTTTPANSYYTPPTTGAQPAGQAPLTQPVLQQAGSAQTYSQTPGAAPAAQTTNQGTQDVVRNAYVQRATQGTAIDPNDPNLRQQLDPFAAAQERARRDYLSEAAERASTKGLGDSGALDVERRLASERAGQATGAFQAQLVGHELQNRRAEIQEALSSLQKMVETDVAAAQDERLAQQQMALQKELAEMDAALKKLGIETGAKTAADELALKQQLGLGGLNVDLMRLLLQGQQFADELGFNVADRTAYWDNQALQNLMAGAR